MQQKDFLIMGQGLAGSLLAWELTQKNQSIIIVDNDKVNASKIAAGIINPITGKRLVKTEGTDEFLAFAKKYYQKLSEFFTQEFYSEIPMIRVLRDRDEFDYVQKRIQKSGYADFIEEYMPEYPGLLSGHGIIKQGNTAVLKIKLLLSRLKEYFIKQGSYIKTEFNTADISLGKKASWRNIQFKYIVFCEGYKLNDNVFFNWLPLKPVKGEILTLSKPASENIKSFNKNLISFGYWLIPENNTSYRLGATFDRENINNESTEQAKKELFDSLVKTIPIMKESTIVSQQAGIRPTTIDREPMIGSHPKYSQLFVFNGFGTKGSLLMPYYCNQLANHILNDSILSPKVNIERFHAKYISH